VGIGSGHGVSMGMGMMWEESRELNRKWECWYANGREWELGSWNTIGAGTV